MRLSRLEQLFIVIKEPCDLILSRSVVVKRCCAAGSFPTAKTDHNLIKRAVREAGVSIILVLQLPNNVIT